MIKNYLLSNSNRYAPKWLVLLIDTLIIGASFVLSYFIRFNLTLNFDVEKLAVQLPAIMVIAALSLVATGSYKGFVRHTGIKDVYNLFNAVCFMSIVSIFTVVLNRELVVVEGFTIPLSIIIIHSLISFIAIISARYIF